MAVNLVTSLQIGSQGAQVLEAQTLLTQRGYSPGPLDGIFGDKTKIAVSRFQSDRGFAIDGIIGPVTWAALHGILPTTPTPAMVPAVATSPLPTTIMLPPGSSAKIIAGMSPVTLVVGGLGLLTLVSMSLARPKRKSTRRR